jgi:hypothetical protein
VPQRFEMGQREWKCGSLRGDIQQYEVTPDYIAGIIDEYNNDRLARHEEYLRRRAAWLDDKKASNAPTGRKGSR